MIWMFLASFMACEKEGDTGEGIDCTLEALYSVNLSLTDPEGNPLTDAEITYTVDGVEGQQKTIVYSSNSGGSYQPTVEPSTFANGSTITLNNQGSTLVLTFIDTIGWCITGFYDITVIQYVYIDNK